MPIKQAIKALLPKPLVRAFRQYRVRDSFKEYRELSTQEVFAKIYKEGIWGNSDDPAQNFFSGIGSHDEKIVSVYVEVVKDFLATFKEKPSVVDLGCGDFYVGSSVRTLCGRYIACDIVPKLIEFNKAKYEDLNVDFRVLDFTTEALPAGDVVFVRQVLQHLSNSQIQLALSKISSLYRYLVLTEHLPYSADFEHNLDKPAGPDIRIAIASGVVLTSPPFNLKAKSERQLCQVHEAGGTIRTTLYELR